MFEVADRIQEWVDTRFPLESSRRKLAEILSVILLAEGASVLLLFSYVGVLVGLASLILGVLLLLIFRRSRVRVRSSEETFGVRLVEHIMDFVGGELVFSLLGIFVVCTVLVYNVFASARPDIGDLDTLVILFGVIVVLYPRLRDRYLTEGAFAVVFLAVVVLFLAAPQAIMAISGGGDESGIGNWYVHYMLAAPFSGMLDLAGIESHSVGNVVSITFEDGSIHMLSISAYCAGLYSFSIFVSAFIAFILVFEEMGRRVMAVVLSLGLMAAYIGNLLRMFAIGVIGYYEGIDALRWAHANIGWMIFLAWSSTFWYLVIRYAGGRGTRRASSETECEG